MATTVLDHPVLGPSRGVLSPAGRTAQFRGIKYATVSGRWQDPELYHPRPNSDGKTFDATQYGPSCPQWLGGQQFDLALVGEGIDMPWSSTMDELECLNLNITMPTSAQGKKCPVMVWVHGGGFSIGSNSFPQYGEMFNHNPLIKVGASADDDRTDLTRFVEHSVEIGKPVIGVAINYRVGIFGFAASKAAGLSGNYGLRDMVVAFGWIRKYIGDFGGDSSEIMAFGESAAAICLSTLLNTRMPLFDRVCCMSGDTTTRSPRDDTFHTSLLETCFGRAGISPRDMGTGVAMLRQMPADAIVAKLPGFQFWCGAREDSLFDRHCAEIVDGLVWLTGRPSWCRSVAIGSMYDDGTIFESRVLDQPKLGTRLRETFHSILVQSDIDKLATKYKLTLGENESKDGALRLMSDITFYLGQMATKKQRLGGQCHTLHIHRSNPLEGPYKGLASHELDVAFLLMNYNHLLPGEDREVGKKIANHWIDMAYGDHDEPALNTSLAFEADGSLRFMHDNEYDEVYRNGALKVFKEIGIGKCLRLGGMLHGLYPPPKAPEFHL